MKSMILVLVALLPALMQASKIPSSEKETYAKFAERNQMQTDRSLAQYQYMTCYDYFGQGGSSYRVTDYISDMYSTGWNDRFSSCCYYGVWVLYEDRDYNERNTNAVAHAGWGENFCEDFDSAFNDRASSTRFIGAPDGYKYSTLSLFQYKGYMGLEQYTYGDQPNLNYDNLGASAIVTGCDPWTLYEDRNYNGRCACVTPADTTQCYPGFYESFGSVANSISSVRRGCYCNKKIAPSNIAMAKSASAAIGGSQSINA